MIVFSNMCYVIMYEISARQVVLLAYLVSTFFSLVRMLFYFITTQTVFFI